MAVITVTIGGTTAPQRTRAFAAWGAFLHPGTNATAAEIEAYLRNLVIQVTQDYELAQARAAVAQPAALDP